MDHPVARRTVIAGAGAGAVSALVTQAQAETRPDIQASEFWASKGNVKLYLYRKRAAPKAGDIQPVVFLVHGSSNSARTSYDLTGAGQGRVFIHERARRIRLRCLDDGSRRLRPLGLIRQQFRYRKRRRGPASRDAGRDAGERRQKVHMYGTSSGAIRAGALRAGRAPSASTGWCSPPLPTRAPARPRSRGGRAVAEERYRNKPRRLRDAAMIRSSSPRDGLPSAYDPAVAEALAAEELKIRRSGADRHLSRHGGEPAAGRS
jgi:hypothetical protein